MPGFFTGAAGATLTVNSTTDTDVATDALLTLREAILISNGTRAVGASEAGQVSGTPSGGLDNIEFALGAGTPSISVGSGGLPVIFNPVFINGNTGGSTRVELNGAAVVAAGGHGLTIASGGCRIRSLVINRFAAAGAAGIFLEDFGSNTIEDCYIGTNAAGTAALANNRGIQIGGLASNVVGGTAAGAGNLISGNTTFGILITAGATANRIEGNYIGTNASGTAAIGNAHGIYADGALTKDNIIGGTAAGARNIISGNGFGITIIEGANANRVEGNYIGTDVSGALDLGNTMSGVRLDDTASANVVGGTAAGARNVISGNDFAGVLITGGATTNRVEGNYIGTNATGTATLGNARSGVVIDTAVSNVIGGTVAAARNVISGNSFWGVEFIDLTLTATGATGNSVQGNYIGTDVTGAVDLGNLLGGVHVVGSTNTIGGAAAGAGNLIAFNRGYGVRVAGVTGATMPAGNAILGNSISGNVVNGAHAGLGIDLVACAPDVSTCTSGVTANDTGDGDIGPNGFQNFPVLECAVSANGQTVVKGTLNSTASASFTIQFFSNAACDLSGNGEGQTFLGQTTVMTDVTGNAAITATLTPAVAAGQLVTATATNAANNTSEFSACATVTAPTLAINDVTVTEGSGGTTNAVFTVTLSGALGVCLPVTVNYATANVSATTPEDYTMTTGTLTFTPPFAGATVTQMVTVPIVVDTLSEPDETFQVNLSLPGNATITDSQGIGTIVNDDLCFPITINPPALPDGWVGVAYSQTLTASGSTAPYTFAVTAGALPGGLSLSAAGVLSGTPTAAGTFNFTVTATDANLCTGTKIYSLIINTCPAITVTPPSLPGGLAGASYSQTVMATGGVTPHSFSVSAGALPPGLTLATDGALSGTPTTGGVFTFTVKATDVNGCMGTQAYTVVICATITVNPASLPDGFTSLAYSQALTATGGTAPYSFAVTAGALPGGLRLSAAGVLSGTPTSAGTFNFTVTATDANLCTGTKIYSLIISNCPAITVNPATLPNGLVGASYSQTVTATGGATPYSFSLSAGALPAGLTLATDGALSGTPTTAGVFTFTVKATDANGCMGTRAYTLVICATITVNPASLPNGFAGVAYSQTLTATGGTSPYSFAVTTGTPPTGVTLSSGGVLSGTPTISGTFNFTVTATDANGCTGSQSYAVVITDCPAITLNPASLPSGLVGASYSQMVTATGGATPYSFSVSAGTLPAGLTLASGGALSGTPTTAGIFTFTVKATDTNGCMGTLAYTVVICATITVNPASLPNGFTAIAYSRTLTATGGTSPYSFAVTAGALPGGLSLSAAGVLSGTPTAAGTFNFTVMATDANLCTGSQSYSLVITDCPAITVSPASLPSGMVGASYSQMVTAAGGATPYSFSLSAGTLPPGLTLATDGALSGTPTTAGAFTFTVKATDANGCMGTQAYTLVICAAITVNPASLPSGLVGALYSQTVMAAGGATPYSFSLSAGALPPGLTLATDGALSGTPTTAGVFTFTVKATDANGCMGTRAYTLVICATITVNPASLPNGFAGVAYSQTVTATGGTAPYGFAVTSGALPSGVTLSSGGVLAGTPVISGTFNFTVTATDANGCTGSQSYSLVINDCPAITVNPVSLPSGLVGASYSQTVTATGGATPHSFSVSAGTLPPGLTLASGGALSGTPPTAGTFTFTVKATDANGCMGIRAYTLMICPTISINPTSLPNGFAGVAYSQTLTAAGGTAPHTFAVTSGALPSGVTLSPGGVLTGTPAISGTFNFTVTATDANGCTGSQSYTVVISDCPAITVNPSSLPSGLVGAIYNQTVTATGGATPHSFSLSTGTLPSGLTLASSGTLSGTPTTAGVFTFTVKATDANGCVGMRAYALVICAAITVNPASLPGGFAGASYSQTVTAAGGATPYSFSLSAGTLPPGLTLATDGSLSGTPTTGGAFIFTVKATDANGCMGTRAYTVVICATITVNPASLPSGFANAPYSQTLTATGGTAPYTFALTPGPLPPGVALSSDGIISGTPTVSGTFNFTVTATDANGCTGLRSYSIIINNCPAITVNPTSLPSGFVGASYSQMVTATGGATPYGFSVSAGALPAGLTLTSGGALSGTPTTGGVFNFTVKATDMNGCMGTRAYTVVICSTITVNPASLPNGFAGVAYSQTLTATGGTSPHSLAVTSGALPSGVTLSSGGALSGTPLGGGTFNFTVTATDANGCTGSQNYSVVVNNCPAITVTPSSLPSGLVGALYNQSVTATGGATPHNFSLSAGTLPPGLTLASDGALSGTPTTSGIFSFTVKATDANGCMGTRAYTLMICATITVNPGSLPGGFAGVAYSQTLTATGGTSPYSFAVTSGALPSGVTLSSGGVLAGTPTISGTFNFTATATDNLGCTGSRIYSIVISDCPAITVNPSSLPGGLVGTSYSQTITAIGGATPHSFSLSAGTLPAGLTLASDGTLSGTPTTGGLSTFTLKATDANGCMGIRAYTVVICATITVNPASLPNGSVGVAYSQTLTATGGASPHSFAVTAGTLPGGLGLSAGGVLSGTPTGTGTFNFTVTGVDANICTGSHIYTVVINNCPAITVNPASLPSGLVGASYSQMVSATGGATPYSFSLSAGTLPPGLTLASSGALSGTPTTGGAFTFTVKATDANGCMATRAYTLVICATITLNPASLPSGFVGASYSQMLTATGGTAPYSFALTPGPLPPGVTLTSDGVMSGTPVITGTFNFTVTATDANGCTGLRSFSIVINNCPPITVNPTSLPGGLVGASYSQTVMATGGATPYSFSVSAGTLPAGLTLASGGALSGTPTTTGVFNFTVKATDANGCLATRAYTVLICATITLSPASLPSGFVAVPYNQTLTAPGATAPFTFAVSSGALPPGITLSSSGVLAGAPSGVGTSNFTVTVTDANGCTGSQSYSVVVNNCPPITVNPASLPGGLVGASYSQTVTATGGATSYTFSVSTGALPAGLTLASSGALSGTPTTAGVFTFTVKATDVNGCMGTRAYAVVICATIAVNPASLPDGFAGVAYNQTLTATGGTSPYSFAVTAGALPPGITLSSGGALSGAPTGFGAFNFTVTATDANGCTGSQNCSLIISNCAPIIVNPASLPSGLAGASYSQMVTATGGATPYSFSVSVGTLPAGLTLATGGALSGTPTAAGTFNFTVKATDANLCMGTRAYTLVICPTITVNPSSLPGGSVGLTYSQTLTATGGTSPHSFAVTAGTLPGGLSLSAGGVLSGTPAVSGTSNFTVTATDANGCTGARSYTVIIGEGLMYYPLPSPIRVLDTRPDPFTSCFPSSTPLVGGSTFTLPVAGNCNGVTIPASAKAVVGNATVVNFISGGGFMTLFPSDAAQPNASNLNFTANHIVPNSFTVGLGSDGAIKIFTSASTHFIVDITGYYAPPGAGGLYFHPLPSPVRMLDTRPDPFTSCVPSSTPLAGGGTLTLPVAGNCNGLTIPASAKAVVGNATVVNFQSGGGFITLFPEGAAPNASNLNFTANHIVPNSFVTGLSAAGSFNIFASASTNFIVDIAGYFSDQAVDVNGQGLLFYPLSAPARWLDTRPDPFVSCIPSSTPLGAGSVSTLQAQMSCEGQVIPASAKSVLGNATVVNSISAGGFITLFPSDASQPNASNLNFTANHIVPNSFVVGLGGDGKFKIFTSAATHFIVDLSGYFAP